MFVLFFIVSQEKETSRNRRLCESLQNNNPNSLLRYAGAQFRILCSSQGKVPSPPFPAEEEMARASLVEPFPEWPMGISQGSMQAFNAFMTELGQI